MSQKLSANNFEWLKDLSKYDKSVIKSSNEESDKGYFLEVDVQYPENLHILHNDLPSFLKGIKIEKVEKLAANLHDDTE